MSVFERYPISTATLAALNSAGFPAALAEKPGDGGWRGAPASDGSNFHPYTVLVPATVSTQIAPDLGYGQDHWRVPYLVNIYAVRGDQCELLSDRCRVALAGMVDSTITATQAGLVYAVMKVSFTSVGAVTRVDQTDPPFYTQTDTIEVWVSKEPT
jgi:hypothetical protein